MASHPSDPRSFQSGSRQRPGEAVEIAGEFRIHISIGKSHARRRPWEYPATKFVVGQNAIEARLHPPVDHIVEQVNGVFGRNRMDRREIGNERIVGVVSIDQAELDRAFEMLVHDFRNIVRRPSPYCDGTQSISGEQVVRPIDRLAVRVDSDSHSLREYQGQRHSAPPQSVADDEDAAWPDVIPKMLDKHDLLKREARAADRLPVLQKYGERRSRPFREVRNRIAGEGLVSRLPEDGEQFWENRTQRGPCQSLESAPREL